MHLIPYLNNKRIHLTKIFRNFVLIISAALVAIKTENMKTILLGVFGPWQIALIAAAVLLLFVSVLGVRRGSQLPKRVGLINPG